LNKNVNGGEEIGFLSGDSDALEIARSRSYWRQGVTYKDVSQLLAVKSTRANPFQLAPVSPSRKATRRKLRDILPQNVPCVQSPTSTPHP
jgi:hypothetical protein